jgi:uncharacterized membrane protein YfhO
MDTRKNILKLPWIYLLLLIAAISMHAYFIYNKLYFNEGCYSCDSIIQVSHFYPFLHREFLQGNFFWSWKYGLGGDIFSEFLYYFSSSPFFWLTLLFKLSSIQDMYELRLFISIFKHSLTMIFMYHLLRYGKRSQLSSIVGSFIYGGSLYFTFYSFRLDFMVDGMLWLPLLLLGYERWIDQRKKGLFIFTVFLMTCSNFYLAFINSIYLLMYAVVKYFLSRKTYRWQDFLRHYVHTVAWYMVGMLLSAFTLLPAAYTYLNVDRFYDEVTIPLFFEGYFYKTFVYYLFFFIKQASFLVVFPIVVFPVVVLPIIVYFLLLYGFFIREKQTRIRFCFTGFILILVLLPVSYSLFNGLSSLQYRWLYLFVFTVAHTSAFILDHLLAKRNRFTFAYFSICMVLLIGMVVFKQDVTQMLPNRKDLVILVLGVMTCIILLTLHNIPRKLVAILLISVLLLNISFTNLMLFDAYPGNPQALQTRQQDFLSSYAQPSALKMFQDIRTEDPTFYRIMWENIPQFNAPMLYDYYGFSAHNSLLSGRIHKFIKNEHMYNTLQHNMPSSFKNLNHRLYLETTLANKYYVVPIDSSFRPYGYSLLKQTNGYHIFRNDHALPLGFMYHAVVDEQTFATLNYGQRDQLLLHAAVVDHAQSLSLPKFQLQNLDVKSVELPKRDIQLKNATLAGSLLTVKEQAELILPNVFAEELGEVLVDIKLKRIDGEKYELQVDHQLFTYFGDTHIYNYPKDEIVFNTGYQQKPANMTMTLSPGQYELKSITLTLNSYKNYLALTKARRAQSLQNVQFTEQRVSGSIQAQQAGILFLSIPYSEGWHLKVDGVATEALKVNFAFIGVPITKGKHQIELAYRPPYFRLGVGISLATLIFLALYTLKMRKKQHGER